MSLDRSLRAANSLKRHRNVLKRDERLARMEGEGKFPEGRSILGLPKVANRKMAIGGKTAKPEGEPAAEGAAAGAKPAAAAPAASATGGKAPAKPAAKK